jgi:hypothetical protein
MQYLEKIFQIPFSLPPVDQTGYSTMINVLTASAPHAEAPAAGPNDDSGGDPLPSPGPAHKPGRSRCPPRR